MYFWKCVKRRDIGRETFLVKVDWEDDWPVFNNGENIRLRTEGRDGQQLVRQASWEADLTKGALELGWYQKRMSISKVYFLTVKICMQTPH